MRAIGRILVIVALLLVNFMGLWWLFYSLGVKNMPPIGAVDRAGPVIPPKWFFVPVAVLVLIEYGVIFTLLAAKRNKSNPVQDGDSK